MDEAICRMRANRREPDSAILIQRLTEFANRLSLLAGRDTGDDVSGEAAHNEGLLAGSSSFLITSAMIEAKVLPL